MSEPDVQVALQVTVRKSIRKRLRKVSADIELSMQDAADVLLDYAFGLVEAERIPPALSAMIDKAKQAKGKEKKDKPRRKPRGDD